MPPGFGTAFKIVKWAIDPGLDGDVYADKPYLYGPLASSINTLRVGESGLRKESEIELGENGEGMVFEEGGEGDGEELRKERGVPDGEAARKKWFLTEANRKNWEFEAGREHYGDFFNPYLDFNGESLTSIFSTLECLSGIILTHSRFRAPASWIHPSNHEVLGWPTTQVCRPSLPFHSPISIPLSPFPCPAQLFFPISHIH